MRKTDGSKSCENKGRLDILAMLWIFLGIIVIMFTFTGCTAYLLDCVNYSEDGIKANYIAHQSWIVDGAVILGSTDYGDMQFCGINCIYPQSDGCCGQTHQTCYVGCGNISSQDTHVLVAGDTGYCSSELYAGLVNGCPCVYCNDENVFGYYTPLMYELLREDCSGYVNG